jgi:hypothetical protein
MLQRSCFSVPTLTLILLVLTISHARRNDDAFFCDSCDASVHDPSNPVLSKHKRSRLRVEVDQQSGQGSHGTASFYPSMCPKVSAAFGNAFSTVAPHIDDWCKLSQNHLAGNATFRSLLTFVPSDPALLPLCSIRIAWQNISATNVSFQSASTARYVRVCVLITGVCCSSRAREKYPVNRCVFLRLS